MPESLEPQLFTDFSTIIFTVTLDNSYVTECQLYNWTVVQLYSMHT